MRCASSRERKDPLNPSAEVSGSVHVGSSYEGSPGREVGVGGTTPRVPSDSESGTEDTSPNMVVVLRGSHPRIGESVVMYGTTSEEGPYCATLTVESLFFCPCNRDVNPTTPVPMFSVAHPSQFWCYRELPRLS